MTPRGPARHAVLVVGGGIVGLAAARAIAGLPGAPRVVLLEKEPRLAAHQTGRNSGVVHSGIYYRPGSAKARTCRAGQRALRAYCAETGIPLETTGKVIVALEPSERPRLEALLARGRANGVACRRIGRAELRELEPHAAGHEAIHVPETAIVDYRRVAEALARDLRARGGAIVAGAPVTGLRRGPREIIAETPAGAFRADLLVGCAGLHADRVAALAGEPPPDLRIVPFRGEYFQLRPAARALCRGLVYPLPDPAFPFLGVHLTRRIDGRVECGPNAVPALAREGYRWRDLSPRDLAETLRWPGAWRLAGRYWRTGLAEIARSASKAAFVRALRRLVPELRADMLVPRPAGVRAQALGRDGALLDDFALREGPRTLHVLNAPSPAATASLAIGEEIARRVAARGA